jgi:hypothetical protein
MFAELLGAAVLAVSVASMPAPTQPITTRPEATSARDNTLKVAPTCHGCIRTKQNGQGAEPVKLAPNCPSGCIRMKVAPSCPSGCERGRGNA